MSCLNTQCQNCGTPVTVTSMASPCPKCRVPLLAGRFLREVENLPREKRKRTLKSRLLSGG